MELFDQSLTVLEKSLDMRMVSQRIVSSNLANIDTPGYQAQHLNFEKTMEDILAAPGAEDGVQPVIEASMAPALTPDGNNVDMESELGELSRNKLMYSLTSQIIAAKLRQTNAVLSDGA